MRFTGKLHTWNEERGFGFIRPEAGKLHLLAPHVESLLLIVRTPAGAQEIAPAAPLFQCDGRQHCAQMRSCEEAKFFLKNCPDTKMDGNHDGVPCEQQWC